MSTPPGAYLGLDLSLRATGVALIDSENIANCRVLTISVNAALRDGARLASIEKHLDQTFHGRSIIRVAIEGYSFGSKNNQFYLGELGGVVRLYLVKAEIPYIIVQPNLLKKWTTGAGNADKIAMAVSTYEEYGLRFDDDNQCDAFNLAAIAAAYDEQPFTKMTAERKKVLAVIRENPLALPKGKSK